MPDDVPLLKHVMAIMSEREKRVSQLENDARLALQKAETALEKRLDLLNEFRQQSKDAEERFVERGTFDAFRESTRVELNTLAKLVNEAEGRAQAGRVLIAATSAFAAVASAVALVVTIVLHA